MVRFVVCYYNPNAGDASIEYQVYRAILDGHPISLKASNLLVSSLFTTWLPAMLQRITNIDPLLLFKYYTIPLMVWLPLIVYIIFRHFVKPYQAFLAGLLFVMQPIFLVSPMVSRLVISNTFLALGIWVVISNWRLRWKAFTLSACMLMVVAAHYGTAYFAIALLVCWLLAGVVYKLVRRVSLKPYLPIAICLIVLVLGVSVWLVNMTGATALAAKNLMVTAMDDFKRPVTKYSNTAPKVSEPKVVSPSNAESGISISKDIGVSNAESKGLVLEDVTLGTPPILTLDGRDEMTQVVWGLTFHRMNNAQRADFIMTWAVVLLLTLGLFLNLSKNTIFAGGAMVSWLFVGLNVISPSLGKWYGVQRTYFLASAFILVFAILGISRIADRLKIPQWPLCIAVAAIYAFTSSGLLYMIMGYDKFVH